MNCRHTDFQSVALPTELSARVRAEKDTFARRRGLVPDGIGGGAKPFCLFAVFRHLGLEGSGIRKLNLVSDFGEKVNLQVAPVKVAFVIHEMNFD